MGLEEWFLEKGLEFGFKFIRNEYKAQAEEIEEFQQMFSVLMVRPYGTNPDQTIVPNSS